MPPWAIKEDGQRSDPSAPQAEFMRLFQTRDRMMYLGGLGAGKTYTGCWALLAGILENREILQSWGRRGQLLYAMVAPHYQDIADGTLPTFLDVCDLWAEQNGYSLVQRVTKTKPQIVTLTTGDVIKTVAADAGKWKGATIAGALGDELEESADPMAAMKLILKRLRSARAPRRFLVVASTPADEGLGIYPWWEQQTKTKPDTYGLVQASSSSNPAHDGTDYIEVLASAMSAREAASRLEGRPQPPEQTVYGGHFDKAESVAHGWRWPGRIPNGLEIHLCFDWGTHYACLFVLHDPHTGLDIVFDEVHIDGCQTDEFLDAVLQHARKIGIAPRDICKVWCDPQPDDDLQLAMSRRYFRGRVRYESRWDSHTKRESIRVVQWRMNPSRGRRMLLFAPALFVNPHKRGIARSLSAYTWKYHRDAGVITLSKYVRQDHWSSHANDALRQYAWRYRWDRRRALGA